MPNDPVDEGRQRTVEKLAELARTGSEKAWNEDRAEVADMFERVHRQSWSDWIEPNEIGGSFEQSGLGRRAARWWSRRR